jgi:hypothetical protein
MAFARGNYGMLTAGVLSLILAVRRRQWMWLGATVLVLPLKVTGLSEGTGHKTGALPHVA